jgi:hypothetical protein
MQLNWGWQSIKLNSPMAMHKLQYKYNFCCAIANIFSNLEYPNFKSENHEQTFAAGPTAYHFTKILFCNCFILVLGIYTIISAACSMVSYFYTSFYCNILPVPPGLTGRYRLHFQTTNLV